MSTTTLLTFEQFESLPDSPGKQELLDGELQLRIQDCLRPYVLERQMGEVWVEVGYQLGNRHWVQADESFASRQQEQESDPEGYLQGTPRPSHRSDFRGQHGRIRGSQNREVF